MGKPQRVKGTAGERELVRLLNAQLRHHSAARVLGQSRDGGYDIELDLFAIEVKRHNRLNLPAWIEQVKAAARPDQIPVLAWRRDREDWQFAILLDLAGFIDVFEVLAGS